MPKVIVIEDDAHIREMYVAKLRNSGFEVFEAEDGQKGLEIIEKNSPDVVLLDLEMPNLTGQAMIVKLRREEWGKTVPVLVLSNMSQPEANMGAGMLSVERYIVKAYSTPKQIVEAVVETLQKYGKMKEPQT